MRLAIKAAVVVLLMLGILVPLSMIRGTITERQAYRAQAVQAVARSYAGEQALAGPVLVVPYTEQVETEERNEDGKAVKQLRTFQRQWTFFPKSMRLQGRVQPAIRKLGLHGVRVYELQGGMDAVFDVRLPVADPARPRSIGAPWIDMGIGDVRGLAGTPRMRTGASELRILQGQRGGDAPGVHADLPAGIVAADRIAFPLRLDFALRGTEALAIAPLADSNTIVLDSPWPHPQFNGDFLPRARRAWTTAASTRNGTCPRWPAMRRRSTGKAARPRWTPSACRWWNRWTCIPSSTAPASTGCCSCC